jgi:hypothetical protein
MTKQQGKGAYLSLRADEEKVLYEFANFFYISSLVA